MYIYVHNRLLCYIQSILDNSCVSELCSSYLVSELCFSDPGLWPIIYQTLSDPTFSQPNRFRVSLRNLVFDHQPGLWPTNFQSSWNFGSLTKTGPLAI